MATVAEAQATTKNFEKLKRLLEELFQMDQADLDFGIFRIMNAKRDEVVQFLDKDLLPQVKEAFSQYQSADRSEIKSELDDAINQAKSLGADPETIPRVKELREKYDSSSVDVAELESEVFSHLFNFFRRYYHEGDFISLRRYKKGVYAIPYEGEEVKLHWANHDQYYIKSSEYLKDYTFILDTGERVRVHLVAASTEQGNRKEAEGKERRFVVSEEDPIFEENGELFIRFEFRVDDSNKKQSVLNKSALQIIVEALKSTNFSKTKWAEKLTQLAPTEKQKDRTLLEKHLERYTARHTFDYFIHKNLGNFLRRELDFYIKNEVVHLDDVEFESHVRVEQFLSKVRVIRSIAGKVIAFLEHLEDFQRRIWLKKKFVTETNYCVCIDAIAPKFYEEVIANDKQIEEWNDLFSIDKLETNLCTTGYSKPLTVQFLDSNPSLVIDTRHFDSGFRDRLLASMGELKCDGLVVQADNFQGLRFLHKTYKHKVDAVYIDPPYNTDAGPIVYKNGFRSSSWISLLENRLSQTKEFLKPSGVLCVTIDDYQVHELGILLDQIFGKENQLGTAVIRNNPSGRSTVQGFSVCHEYAFFYRTHPQAVLSRFPRSEDQLKRFTIEDGIHVDWRNFRKDGGAVTHRAERPKQFYPLYVDKKSGGIRIPELAWDAKDRHWEILEMNGNEEEVLWPVDEKGKDRVWSLNHVSANEQIKDLRVKITKDGKTQVLRRHLPSAGVLPRSWWDKNTYAAREHGSAALRKLFGDSSNFSFAKSPFAVQDCIWVSGVDKIQGGVVMDYFAGSGTTAQAVIQLNRNDGLDRKFVLVEMAHYFDSVLLPRVKKNMFAPEWKSGAPARLLSDKELERTPKLIKYVRLESYEDALNNLEMKKDGQQQLALADNEDLNEQYTLSYMLDVESRGSQSLLNVEGFRNPDEYKLKVERNGETQLVNVDLVETFNWLLGLTVKHIDVIGTKATGRVRVVTGTNSEGEKVLVLWRNQDDTDNEALEKWFTKQGYNSRDQEYDLIYINGDNNLENLRKEDETWKVRLIEEEFGRLMFDVEDV